uniref:Uncharacterized protein n=1 Tax=Fagus sylvatica TaxID=28930 RepID=A0A2N9F1P2_FAGSY
MNRGYFRASNAPPSTIVVIGGLHALSRATGVLGLAAHVPPRAAATFALQNTVFWAPKPQSGTTIGVLFGQSTIWRWNSLHRSAHAPPRAGESVGDNVHALQRRRIFRSPERGLPSSDSRNWHHVRTPQRTIYHLAVETPPSEAARAVEAPAEFSTRQHARACSSVCEAHATTLLAHA